MEFGEQIARHFLQSGPILLVYLVGIVACFVCWQRGPRAAGLALIGLSILLLGHIVGSIAMYWIINDANRNGADVGTVMLSLSMVRSCGHAIGLGLLTVAVFVDRSPYRSDSSTAD